MGYKFFGLGILIVVAAAAIVQRETTVEINSLSISKHNYTPNLQLTYFLVIGIPNFSKSLATYNLQKVACTVLLQVLCLQKKSSILN